MKLNEVGDSKKTVPCSNAKSGSSRTSPQLPWDRHSPKPNVAALQCRAAVLPRHVQRFAQLLAVSLSLWS